MSRKPYDEAVTSIIGVLNTVIESGNNKCLKTIQYQVLYNEIFKSCIGWKNFAGVPNIYTFIIDYVKQNIYRAKNYITFRAVYDILLFPRRNSQQLCCLLDRYETIFKQREMTLLEHCYLALQKSSEIRASVDNNDTVMSDIERKFLYLQKNK